MRIVPALDLRGGRVVRLLKGDFERETAYPADPLALARGYAAAGVRRLHLVDLDGARGSGDNRPVLEQVVSEVGLEVQVAGGIRSLAAARGWLEAGAAAVVMGTVAVREPELLSRVAAQLPGRVLAALDARGGRPAVRGWSQLEQTSFETVLEAWAEAPLGGVILTSVDRDGTLAGPDLGLLRVARGRTDHPLSYSGGLSTLADLQAVAGVGAEAAILGRSLLEGRIALADALRLFPEPP